jgi:hypothetical protein
VSAAGRRARRQRLIAAGLWGPSTILEARAVKADEDRSAALFAQRDLWLSVSGSLGWQQEQVRRRAERNVRLRTAREARALESQLRKDMAA